MSLRLKQGKFYDEAGNVVPLEHGNKEQIAILEKYRRRREAFEGDGLELDADIEVVASVRFSCICCEYVVSISNEDYDANEATEGLVGKEDQCPHCKQKYVIAQDEYGDPVAKFKK